MKRIVGCLIAVLATGCSASMAPTAPSPAPSTATAVPTAAGGGTATSDAPPTTADPFVESYPPAPVLNQTDWGHAIAQMYVDCVTDTNDRPPTEVASNPAATGPVVAMLGDSITTQIRNRLVADTTHRWFVWSRCGNTTADVTAVGAVNLLLAQHPDVLVVGLGTNDAAWKEPHPGASTGFDARSGAIVDAAAAAGVKCVAWINVGADSRPGPVFVAEAAAVNQAIASLPARSTVKVIPVDWNRYVVADPNLVLDGAHTTPAGQDARLDVTTRAVRACGY